MKFWHTLFWAFWPEGGGIQFHSTHILEEV